MSLQLATLSVREFEQKILNKDSFILNVVATWCSDCTDQRLNLESFVAAVAEYNLSVFELIAQETKGEYISPEIGGLIEQFGGHGFPRTVLINKGNIISADNVEMISENALLQLANKFKQHSII